MKALSLNKRLLVAYTRAAVIKDGGKSAGLHDSKVSYFLPSVQIKHP